MMSLEEFAEEILKEVTEKADGNLEVRPVSGEKNNGVTLTGITAYRPGGNGGAIIYLEGYYEECHKGRMTPGAVAEEVWHRLVEHCNDLDGVDLKLLWGWEAARENIRVKLVNREMNHRLLKKVPYRKFLDLAAIYYVTVDGLPVGVDAAFTVTDRIMVAWGKGEEELYQTAVSNMRLDGEPVFEGMGEILRGMMPDTASWPALCMPGAGMYVLTNQGKIFGAAELLDGGTLSRIGDRLGSDLVVLPSSVHESIIVLAGGGMSYEKLAAIVREVNSAQVAEQERLSDHIYLYEREKGALRIAV